MKVPHKKAKKAAIKASVPAKPKAVQAIALKTKLTKNHTVSKNETHVANKTAANASLATKNLSSTNSTSASANKSI